MKTTKTNSAPASGFIWSSCRVGFGIMIFLWLLNAFRANSVTDDGGLSFLWLVSVIFTFTTSIIHLTKYKQKGLAITALVLSSYLLLTIIVGFLMVVSATP